MILGALFGDSIQDDEGESSAPLGGVLVALVAPLAATLVRLGISRSRELKERPELQLFPGANQPETVKKYQELHPGGGLKARGDGIGTSFEREASAQEPPVADTDCAVPSLDNLRATSEGYWVTFLYR